MGHLCFPTWTSFPLKVCGGWWARVTGKEGQWQERRKQLFFKYISVILKTKQNKTFLPFSIVLSAYPQLFSCPLANFKLQWADQYQLLLNIYIFPIFSTSIPTFISYYFFLRILYLAKYKETKQLQQWKKGRLVPF